MKHYIIFGLFITVKCFIFMHLPTIILIQNANGIAIEHLHLDLCNP